MIFAMTFQNLFWLLIGNEMNWVFVVGAWYLSDLLLQGLFMALEKLYIALVPVFYYIHNFASPWHWIFMITSLSDV